MKKQVEDEAQKHPWLVGVARALLPSILTASLSAFGAWKLLEYQVGNLVAQTAQNTREIAELRVQVPVMQTQNMEYGRRLDQSLQMLADLNNKMDARITFIERWMVGGGGHK